MPIDYTPYIQDTSDLSPTGKERNVQIINIYNFTEHQGPYPYTSLMPTYLVSRCGKLMAISYILLLGRYG